MKIILASFFILVVSFSYSQSVGIGASAIYNIQTESYGFGLRGMIYGKKVNIVPQVSYYPGFNKVHELFLGIGAEYNVIIRRKTRFYGLVHGAFNGWLNHSSSTKDGAKFINWAGEVGVGIAGRKCFQPFLEYRYNLKFQETNLRVGITYILGCKNRYTCPSYL